MLLCSEDGYTFTSEDIVTGIVNNVGFNDILSQSERDDMERAIESIGISARNNMNHDGFRVLMFVLSAIAGYTYDH